MRAFLFILAFGAIFIAFGPADGMTVTPYIDPAYTWDCGTGDTCIIGGMIFAVEIRMDNPDGLDRVAVSLPLRFYGTDGLTDWTLVDKGGELIPNIVMMNGFEYYPFPNPWFNVLDSVFVFSWDGLAADTMNFTGSGTNGMPAGEPLETRLAFWFFIYPGEGMLCIDSCSIPNLFPPGKLDWLFDDPVPSFGGPHCWEIKLLPCGYGDADMSGAINLLDVTFIINYLYKDGPAPVLMQGADADSDGIVNLLDATFLINYLYKDGPAPVC